jgi:hypothetical protein
MLRYSRVTPLVLPFLILASVIVLSAALGRGSGDVPGAIDPTGNLYQRIEALENRVAILEKGQQLRILPCTAGMQPPQELNRANLQIMSPYQPAYQWSYQPAAPSTAPLPPR